jgi:hypothetical protein
MPALGRLLQKAHEFKTCLGYIARSCLKKPKEKGSKLPAGWGRSDFPKAW